MHKQKVAVIGAGPCGLAACKALADFGLAYDCLEAGHDLGGIWNVECGKGGYRSLHTNTSTRSMAFSDFPFSEDYPDYPNAAQMTAYFRRYADHFSLAGNICFKQRVTSARPRGDGSWLIELDTGESREYSSVIVATGQYAAPRSPHHEIPGEFDGDTLHVSEYFDATAPLDLRGKRVLVVGLGTSAAEVAADLCNQEAAAGQAGQVILSARSGRWVLPKIIDGKPLDSRGSHPSARVPGALRALPGGSGQWIMRRLFGKFLRREFERLGGAGALGLPEPGLQPWEERPTMSAEFVPTLQAGRIDVRAGIDRFAGSTVHFSDGTDCEVDAVLYATGYALDFPFLDAQTLGCGATSLKLYRRVSHPEHDGLFFVGCCRAMCSLWPLAEQQAYWIARLLSGDFALPASAVRRQKAHPLSDSLPVLCNFYVEELRREARELAPVSPR